MNDYKKFKEVFTRTAIKYAEYVESRISKESQILEKPEDIDCTNYKKSLLMNEVRTANVVAVTLSRMEALEAGKTFGVNAET